MLLTVEKTGVMQRDDKPAVLVTRQVLEKLGLEYGDIVKVHLGGVVAYAFLETPSQGRPTGFGCYLSESFLAGLEMEPASVIVEASEAPVAEEVQLGTPLPGSLSMTMASVPADLELALTEEAKRMLKEGRLVYAGLSATAETMRGQAQFNVTVPVSKVRPHALGRVTSGTRWVAY